MTATGISDVLNAYRRTAQVTALVRRHDPFVDLDKVRRCSSDRGPRDLHVLGWRDWPMTVSEGGEPGSVMPQRLAADLSRRLENEIIGRGWPIGEVLGSETELQERFGVTRPVLREAIRLLEHCRVARMRRGPSGGLVVSEPDATTAIRALVIYLEYLGVTVEQLITARLLLEPLAARLAADSITENGVELLRATVKHEQATIENQNSPEYPNFHDQMAHLSGNPVLDLLTQVLTILTHRYFLTSHHVAAAAMTEAKVQAAQWHTKIVDAVIAGDGAAAQTRLIAHLNEVRDWMLAQHIHTQPQRMRTRPVDPDPQPMAKRFEEVAGQIHADITDGDLKVGDILGSETELLARYSVSRAVLREALHILEHHSVARMRRGPGGGLVILAPNPTASFRTIALYLDYQKSGPRHLHSVREAIESGCIQIIAADGLSQHDASQLRSTLRNSPEDNEDTFHTALAGLADNPVLSLFLRIITELQGTNNGGDQAAAGEGGSAQVRNTHEKILHAMIDGDQSLAQHRMRRHLQDLITRSPAVS